MKLRGLSPNSYVHVSVSDFIYFHNRSAYSAAGKKVEQSWEYIKIAHRYTNVGTEGAQFLLREYINRIFFAVDLILQ
jgi:hypothetical protein